MKVYISGCMTMDPEHYVEHFNSAEKVLKERGYIVTNPAAKEHFDRVVLANRLEDPWSDSAWKDFIKYDIDLVSEHNTIALLNGWENSMGVYVELAVAKRFGLNVLFERDNFKTLFFDWTIKDLKDIENSLSQ